MKVVDLFSETRPHAGHWLPPAEVAANDCARTAGGRDAANVNALVAAIVGRVSALRGSPRIELVLAAGRPRVHANATVLSFAIAGILGALVRSAADGADEPLRVEIRLGEGWAKVLLTAQDVPPLRYVRALDGTTVGERDRTLLHCRRLVEAHDGTVELAAGAGRLGVSVAFPTLPSHHSGRVLEASVARDRDRPAEVRRVA